MAASASPPRAQPHLRVHAVNVYVRDQDRSLRFYVDQLGFNVAFDLRTQSGDRWIAVAPPDGTAVLMLVAPPAGSKAHDLIGRATGIVFVTDDVPAKYAEWLRRGVHFLYAPRLRRVDYYAEPSLSSGAPPRPSDAQARLWGGVFTHFNDLDGNTFALVGFDPVTHAIEEQRRAAAQKLEAERRTEQELEIARQVQARLFPQTLPVVRTLDYAGACIQARQVGGDYFDFLNLGSGRFGIVIGDIAGKGIAAALLMANLQANLRIHCAMDVPDVKTMLSSVNRVFYRNSIESAYATLFFAEYDIDARLLLYANCGHAPAFLLRHHGALERLESTATVLGLFADWNCSVQQTTLSPGDILAFYSDGITESFNEAGDDFGEERLIDSVRRHAALCPNAAVAAILDDVQRWGGEQRSDDVTLIVAKCRS